MSSLKVSDLSVNYGNTKIVKSVSFELKKGEMCALLGANGSGKTTLIKGICSLLKHSGNCTIGNISLENLTDKTRSSHLGYIPQKCSIGISISALDVVMMGFSPALSTFQKPNEKHREIALKELEKVGLLDIAEKNFLTLSEGQKQLVIISRALVQNTPFLLFDEPDSALDFVNKHMVLNMIKSVCENEKGALISLHDPNIALKYCTKALLLKHGECISEIDIKNADPNTLLSELSKIYGKIDIIEHNDEFLIVHL